jgi:hypothetical protein
MNKENFMNRSSLGPVIALALMVGAFPFTVGACDSSKDELLATQRERDQIKAQLVTLQGTVDGMKKDLDSAKAEVTKCQQPPATDAAAAATAPAAGKTTTPAGKAAPSSAKKSAK